MREKALRALASLARDEANQMSMWQTAALVAAVRAGAADGQSEAVCRAVCHTGLKPKGTTTYIGNPGWGGVLAQPATHTHTFGPSRLGQSLWIVVNLSLDQPMVRRFMWADDARGGVRQLLLHSAANGQVEQLRVLAFCALTSLAGDVENSGPMWRDGATRAATVRAAASPGPGPGSRPSPDSDRNHRSARRPTVSRSLCEFRHFARSRA